jgi:hypothetical protein
MNWKYVVKYVDSGGITRELVSSTRDSAMDTYMRLIQGGIQAKVFELVDITPA